MEKRLSAIHNHLVSAFRQSGRKFDKERLSAAVGGWNPAPAKDSDAQLAVFD